MFKSPKSGLVIAGVIGFVLVALLAWKALTPAEREPFALRDQEEKIRDLEDRVAKLQKELDESSKRITPSQGGSAEPPRARRSQRNNARPDESRQTERNAAPEPRLYETVRTTAVFEEPSSSSRKVGTIPHGSRVRVVAASGDWLEVRSRQGRPPGFIRSDDAVLSR